jgi:hypothetical protein
MDNEYKTSGYKVYENSLKKWAENFLVTLLQTCDLSISDDHKKNISVLEKYLIKTFNSNSANYLTLMTTLANLPLLHSLPNQEQLKSVYKDCGIKNPILQTSPLIHIVSKALVLENAKVFTPWHQDAVSTAGSENMGVIWIPITDVDESNYSVEVIPESHSTGILRTKDSAFGHEIDEDFELKGQIVKASFGSILTFSQYLIHRTIKNGHFRIALSFRVNDFSSSDWKMRHYYNPFVRTRDKKDYEDQRHKPSYFPTVFG